MCILHISCYSQAFSLCLTFFLGPTNFTFPSLPNLPLFSIFIPYTQFYFHYALSVLPNQTISKVCLVGACRCSTVCFKQNMYNMLDMMISIIWRLYFFPFTVQARSYLWRHSERGYLSLFFLSTSNVGLLYSFYRPRTTLLSIDGKII